MRTCSEVHNHLQELGVAHEMVHLPDRPRTAERAAALLDVTPEEVVTSRLFLVDGVPTLVLVPGGRGVDEAALVGALNAERVVLAAGGEVVATTGFRPNAVPPCGLASDLPVVADPRVFAPTVVYCGGGAESTMLKIRSADLEAVLRPLVADVAVP